MDPPAAFKATYSRGVDKEKKISWEMDMYGQLINDALQDEPMVKHLLPIEPGGYDLAEKVRDGLLLACFINRIPGYSNIIDVKKLHRVTKGPDGRWGKLNMFQVAQNQDLMLQAAKFMGIPVENVGVLDLIEAPKNKVQLLKLLQEVLKFHAMEKLAAAAEELELEATVSIDGDDLEERKMSSLSGLTTKRKKRREVASLGRSPGMDSKDDENFLRQFANNLLESAEAPERIPAEVPLNVVLADGKIYLRLLHILSPENCSVEMIYKGEALARTSKVLEYCKALGMSIYMHNYDIVYGDSAIHFQMLSELAMVAAKNRLSTKKSSQSSLKERPGIPDVFMQTPTSSPKSSQSKSQSSPVSVPEPAPLSVSSLPVVERPIVERISDITPMAEIKVDEQPLEEAEISRSASLSESHLRLSPPGTLKKRPSELVVPPIVVNVDLHPQEENKRSRSKSLSSSRRAPAKPNESQLLSAGAPSKDIELSLELSNSTSLLASPLIEPRGSRPALEDSKEKPESSKLSKKETEMPMTYSSVPKRTSTRMNYSSQVKDPTKKNDTLMKRIITIFLLVLGLLLIIIGCISPYLARAKIVQDVKAWAPLTSSSQSQLKDRPGITRIRAFDYKNLNDFVSGGANTLDISEAATLDLAKTTSTYNVSFADVDGKGYVSFMTRDDYQISASVLDKLQNSLATTPSIRYISLLGSNYQNPLIHRIPRVLSGISSFLTGTLTTRLSRFLIPCYFGNIRESFADPQAYISAMQSWAVNGTVLVVSQNSVPLLSSSVSLELINYVLNESAPYSLVRRSLSTNGIRAWTEGSSAAVLQSSLIAAGVSPASVASEISIIQTWLSNAPSHSSFIPFVKAFLFAKSVSGSTDTDAIFSLSDLSIFQFATGRLIPFLNGGSGVDSFASYPELFSNGTIQIHSELGYFLSHYYDSLYRISIPQAKQLLNPSANAYISFGSFLSSLEQGSVISSVGSFGITPTNAHGFAGYVKHILKHDYFVRTRFPFLEVDSPPSTVEDLGLFSRTRYAYLFTHTYDPNVVLEASSLDFFPNPIVGDYNSNDEHWTAHPNEYTVSRTGTDDIDSMHSSIRLEGKSRTLGVWRDPVVLSGLYGTVGISPNSNGITSKFIFWDGNLRRGFQFVDSGEKIDYPNLNGVRRYKLDSSELKNQESVPDNGIYYMTGPDGFLNMAPSFFGAPIWISQPHFQGADTSRYSYLSFSPNAQKHESYIDIEPLSGLVVRAAIRWQWNVLLKKQDFFTEPYYSNLFSSRDELMLPVFWIEENIEISTEAYTQLSDIMATQSSGKIALIVCLILGLIMFLVGLVMLYKLSKEQTSYRKPVEI